MTTQSYSITGMTCGNCVRHVTEAVSSVEGVSSVSVDLETGTATVTSDGPVDDAAVAAAVDDAGYQVAS
jgi:copper ion binding protein